MTLDLNNDAKVLALYRRAFPYISLHQAKELHRIDAKFGHLGRVKMQQEQQEQQVQSQAQRELEELLRDASEGE